MTVKLPPLVSPEIAALVPYQPGKPLEELQREMGDAWPKEGAIKLASNENPLGPSPLAMAAAHDVLIAAHRYPDGGTFALREKLAQKFGVPRARVIVGAGSNELIDLLVQTFVAPDQEVLSPAYSFACYALSARAHRRRFCESAVGPGFALDVEALLAAVTPKTRLVFVANPNNPTGAYLGRAALTELVRRLPPEVVLAVDEAYFEYARAADYPDATELFGERERLVVLRTFSKIYGLAALRAGYAITTAEIVDALDRVRLAFNVSTVAQVAALAALDDTEHVTRSQQLNARELGSLSAGLESLGLHVLPSQANFVLVGLGEGGDAHALYERLLARGVIVRPVANYGLREHLRITVGTEAENRRLLAALGTAR